MLAEFSAVGKLNRLELFEFSDVGKLVIYKMIKLRTIGELSFDIGKLEEIHLVELSDKKKVVCITRLFSIDKFGFYTIELSLAVNSHEFWNFFYHFHEFWRPKVEWDGPAPIWSGL